jgi:CotS family spore coat protein
MREKDLLRLSDVLGTPVWGAEPFRNVWRVRTFRGDWVAKPVRHVTHLRWWMWVDREMRMRGFHLMPQMRTDGKRWVLTPFIPGQTASYKNLSDARQAARQLAWFHRTGDGLKTRSYHHGEYLLKERLDTRLREFYRMMMTLGDGEQELAHLVKTYGPFFYQAGVAAMSRLNALGLRAWVEWDRHLHRLAHRDLASHNWLTDLQGRLWLIDFETADYDCQLGDVWQLLSRTLSEHHWVPEVYRTLLAEYEAVRPLSNKEKTLLVGLLSFPNEFFRETVGLTKEKRGYTLVKSLPYVRQVIRDREHWQRFLETIRSW